MPKLTSVEDCSLYNSMLCIINYWVCITTHCNAGDLRSQNTNNKTRVFHIYTPIQTDVQHDIIKFLSLIVYMLHKYRQNCSGSQKYTAMVAKLLCCYHVARACYWIAWISCCFVCTGILAREKLFKNCTTPKWFTKKRHLFGMSSTIQNKLISQERIPCAVGLAHTEYPKHLITPWRKISKFVFDTIYALFDSHVWPSFIQSI